MKEEQVFNMFEGFGLKDKTEVGLFRVDKHVTRTTQYECAAWYKRHASDLGQFPVFLRMRKCSTYPYSRVFLQVELPATVTGSNFTSLFGGVPVGEGKIDEDVGERSKIYIYRELDLTEAFKNYNIRIYKEFAKPLLTVVIKKLKGIIEEETLAIQKDLSKLTAIEEPDLEHRHDYILSSYRGRARRIAENSEMLENIFYLFPERKIDSPKDLLGIWISTWECYRPVLWESNDKHNGIDTTVTTQFNEVHGGRSSSGVKKNE